MKAGELSAAYFPGAHHAGESKPKAAPLPAVPGTVVETRTGEAAEDTLR